MCDHQEKDHKRGKTANSKSHPTTNHHQNQGRHQHQHKKKSHQSDDTHSQETSTHSSAEGSLFSDHQPDHRRPSVNDQTHRPPSHRNHHKQSHHRVSLTEASRSSSTSSSSHSSSSSSSSTSSSPSSFSSSSLSSSSSASSSSLSSDSSGERLDKPPQRKPQHSQSCTDISGKRRYSEEGDDTAPLIEGGGDQNKQSTRKKREKGKSSRNRPSHSKRQKTARGSGNDFRKSKSMEALTGPRDSDGDGSLDDIEQETSKCEAKKNLMKEKKKFSAFLNEITRQVLSPMRLTTLGVTDAQRHCSPRQASSTRASKIDSRTEKHRQHRNRPTSADSVTSSRHSHTSQRSTRLSNSQSFPHHHSYDSADSPNHMYHRPRSCTDISRLRKPHTQTPQHHNRSSSYKSRHRHQGDHTSSHHDHHHDECRSPSPQHHHGHCRHRHRRGDHHSPTHHHGEHHNTVQHHRGHHSPSHHRHYGDHHHGDRYSPAHHHGQHHTATHHPHRHGDHRGPARHYHHGEDHGHAPHHEDNTTHHYHHGDPPNTSHHREGRHNPTHDHGDHNSGHNPHSSHPDTDCPTTPHQHRHHSLSPIEHRDYHSRQHHHHHGGDQSPAHHHLHGDHHSPPHHHHHGDHHSPPHHHHHGDDHSEGHHHGDDHRSPHHHHHGDDHSPPHHHHYGDDHSEGHHHHHGDDHSPPHHHHHGDDHSPPHHHHHGDDHSPPHHHHHGDHHNEGHNHGDHHNSSHQHHRRDHHSSGHQHHHGSHHTESHQNHQGDHHSPGHQHNHGDHHADTQKHHQGDPPESHLNQSYFKNNEHDHQGHGDHHPHLKGRSDDSPPSHRKPESLITEADPVKKTLSRSSLEEERTSFTDSSAHKEEAHEMGRIIVQQEKNEGLHSNLLNTAVRMECLGEEFVNSQKILEAELQKTRMELSSLSDKFKRLHDSCSSTQQTNNLLQLKLNSVAQNMEGERERLNQRISALTEQLADAKFGNSVETFKAGDAINPVVLPIAPPPAQFMDTHNYGNTNTGGQDQSLGSVPEEEESDWSEIGDEIPRFILTGSNRIHAWRHQEADVDKDSESGGEETVGRLSAQLWQTSHLQFKIHNEILPAPQSNACPTGFKNLSDSMTAEGNYRITSSPNLGSSILIRSASLEEIPLARHHMQKELRGTEAMMDLHHPQEDVIGDLDNEIIHHWRTNSDREAAMGMLAESRMSDVNSGLASLQTAEQMLNHFIRESQASEDKGQGRAEVHGWMGGIPDEVLKVERTKL
ncbi:LIM domain-containing protein A [Platichthys flesus]|uniref:LIM domain-containing protein A n=1 Tax=Platichthys flesus TaxID=8260 RepID=UPI002DB83E0D|nr:LIM domain-containing protein A [Platichthys flesus]